MHSITCLIRVSFLRSKSHCNHHSVGLMHVNSQRRGPESLLLQALRLEYLHLIFFLRFRALSERHPG